MLDLVQLLVAPFLDLVDLPPVRAVLSYFGDLFVRDFADMALELAGQDVGVLIELLNFRAGLLGLLLGIFFHIGDLLGHPAKESVQPRDAAADP